MPTRTYIHLAEAWYGSANITDDRPDDIQIGLDHSGEVIVRWVRIGDNLVPQLTAFDDSWHVLRQLHDLIDAMAEHDDENMTPAAFCAMLDGLGFVDVTPRERESR